MDRIVTAGAPQRARRSIVAEIAGPAGSGKSTLFDLLVAAPGPVSRGPTLGRTRHAPLLARHAVTAAWTLARARALSDTTAEQVLAMAYVQALPTAIAHRRARLPQVVVLDQGPIYFLSRPFARRNALRPWRERWLAEWSGGLDLVVWLDAPDDVLVERIRTRPKEHALKEAEDAHARDVLGDARAASEDALARLTTLGGPQILRFDTSTSPPDAIATELFPLLMGCVDLPRATAHAS